MTTRKRREIQDFDLLPEIMAYRDTGCEISEHCLECPLPSCKYDDPLWYRAFVRFSIDQERLAVYELMPTNKSAARKLGISDRTLQRTRRRMAERAA